MQRVRVMNMPADVRWTITGLQEPVRLELEGAGPMGIGLRAEYGIEYARLGLDGHGRHGVQGRRSDDGGPSSRPRWVRSLRGSLAKLKARVEA